MTLRRTPPRELTSRLGTKGATFSPPELVPHILDQSYAHAEEIVI